MQRAGLYMRVSTVDQHPETQLLELRQMAKQRGFEIVREYTDRASGVQVRRPAIDEMLHDARRGQFDVLLVWAFDRLARSVRHFLEVVDELTHVGVQFVSLRENVDTSGPLGRTVIVIIGAIAELERNLIRERVRAGMRRAKLEGRHIGRPRLELDIAGMVEDRADGLSLKKISKMHGVSKTTVARALQQHGTKALTNPEPQTVENSTPKLAA